MQLRWCLWLVLLFACSQKEKEPYVIIWKAEKAVAVSFDKSVGEDVTIHLTDSSINVLGDIRSTNDRIIFTPVVPFHRGYTYKTKNFNFTIPADTNLSVPRVLNTYPSCDTVPANLLKIYIAFSEPMEEGKSSEYVALFSGDDPVKNAFLDLKPELWNEDGTVLTLWLDPGRIKQDLIPNKELGTVLEQGAQYRLMISEAWRSKKGSSLGKFHRRLFNTSARDVSKPDTKTWSLITRNDSIFLSTHEPLDWSLLHSTITVWNDNKQVPVKSVSEVCERHLTLITGHALASGNYELRVEARLEDLAGNNLNRLFETDISTKQNSSPELDLYTVPFKVN